MNRRPIERPHRPRGFTLIELLLAVGLMTILLGTVAGSLMAMLQSRTKNATVAEVELQGQAVLQRTTQVIRNAIGIASPLQGVSSSTLALTVPDLLQSPTVFTVSGGILTMSQGLGVPVALTSDRVSVTGLTFLNASRTDTPGTVRLQFTLEHSNPEGRNEYAYQQTFITSASLREQ